MEPQRDCFPPDQVVESSWRACFRIRPALADFRDCQLTSICARLLRQCVTNMFGAPGFTFWEENSSMGRPTRQMIDLGDREASAALVAECRNGDRLAFRQLYDLYKDRVYSIAAYFFH